MALAENIKRLRKNHKWSQGQLADRIDTHVSHVNRIETGKYKPSVDVLMKLSEVFEVSLDYLVSDTDEDFTEVTIKDKALADRIKLIDTLEPEDREALIRVVDSMLTKKKILKLITQEDKTLLNTAG